MKFSESHEWVEWRGEVVRVGISDYAQRELGEVVYVELPRVGAHVRVGDEVVVIESTKSAVDIYAPLSGEITEVNEALKGDPGSINRAAEGEGWLFCLRPAKRSEEEQLMDRAAYLSYISGKK